MKNNVVVFDLDGTLLNSKNEIIGGKETLENLHILKQMGCDFAVCTGRLDHDILKIGQTYDIPMYHRISQNGAVIYKENTCNALLLDKQEGQLVYEFLKHKDVRVELNTISNRYWLSERDEGFPKELYDSHITVDTFEEILQFQPAVLFLVIGASNELKEIAKYIDKHCHFIKAVMTSSTSLEILNSGASKGNAICLLYPHSNIYAIGDSPNDFDMLASSTFGYLVSDCACTIDCIRKDNILEAILDIKKRLEVDEYENDTNSVG